MKTMRVMTAIWLVGAAVGCSDDNKAADGPSSNPDAPSTVVVNQCTTFADHTADSTTTVTFPTGGSPAQYSPPCVKIKAGSKVTFSGTLSSHPLNPVGGDSPSPIHQTTTGSSVDVTFASAGTFGFKCGNHPTIMFGAVQVVP